MEVTFEDGGSQGCTLQCTTRLSPPAAVAAAAGNTDAAPDNAVVVDDNAVAVVPCSVPASVVAATAVVRLSWVWLKVYPCLIPDIYKLGKIM